MQNLHILKATGRLGIFETAIQHGFEKGLEKVKVKLNLPNVDVVVADNPSAAIPETGVGGFAPSAHLVYINIDPDHLNLQEIIGKEIESTLAHELHHCARWQTIGYGKTLLEAVVSEGLADHFDIEVNGGMPKPWSVAVQGLELEKIKEMAKADFSNINYNHQAWFFGSESERIPRWAGYSIGFEMVKNYKIKSGRTAAELVSEDSTLFAI